MHSWESIAPSEHTETAPPTGVHMAKETVFSHGIAGQQAPNLNTEPAAPHAQVGHAFPCCTLLALWPAPRLVEPRWSMQLGGHGAAGLLPGVGTPCMEGPISLPAH